MKIEVEIGTLGGLLAEIGSERNRQINAEGWTPVHDDGHDKGELAVAAACYAIEASGLLKREPKPAVPFEWPWDASWWKPSGPRRNLVKACALLVAEIQRIDRLTSPASDVPGEVHTRETVCPECEGKSREYLNLKHLSFCDECGNTGTVSVRPGEAQTQEGRTDA